MNRIVFGSSSLDCCLKSGICSDNISTSVIAVSCLSPHKSEKEKKFLAYQVEANCGPEDEIIIWHDAINYSLTKPPWRRTALSSTPVTEELVEEMKSLEVSVRGIVHCQHQTSKHCSL